MRVTPLFQKSLKFIQAHKSIWYSLILIIVIPSLLISNLFFVIGSFQRNLDYELQQKGLLAENVLDVFGTELISQPQKLQHKIKALADMTPSVADLTISIPAETPNKFRIIASLNPEDQGKIIEETLHTLAWTEKEASTRGMATIVSPRQAKGERFWVVVKPLHNEKNQRVALVSLALSLKAIDALVQKTLQQSFIFLSLSVLAVIFLVAHHTRLFGYVKLAQKLKELDKMKNEFISMATHELRAPITGIRGFLSLVMEGSFGRISKPLAEALQKTMTLADHLKALLEDLLEVSRIQQRKIKLEMSLVKPEDIVKKVVEEFKPQAMEKNLKIVFEVPKKLPRIKADPKRLREIVGNLIDNAIKYTVKGQVEVRLSCQKWKNQVVIEVKDTGIGLSAEEQDQLFEKFFRAKSAREKAIPGTGLGLWITRELTEMMDGKIWAQSMEGIGSKFTVSFPVPKKT